MNVTARTNARSRIPRPAAGPEVRRSSKLSDPNRPVTSANRPVIPLGGSPPPPGVPDFAFDQAKINELTLDQIAGIVFNENRDVTPGESTPEQLQKAKIAQAHATINADRKYGKTRSNLAGTASWKVLDSLKGSDQYQQALEAARTAYQEANVGSDPTGGKVSFGNRYKKDVGEHEERLWSDRYLRDKHGHPVGIQKVFNVYGPFFHKRLGKTWTHIFDEGKPLNSTKQAPPTKAGHTVPGRKQHR